MEPNLVTDPKLLNVLNELKAREPIFHHPEFGTSRSDFDNMMERSFWEVGASGKRYSREDILDLLEKRYASHYEDNLEASDFHCLEIAANNFLLTYTLVQDGTRLSRRSTIWRRTSEGWKIVYHQGTLVQSDM